MSWVCLARAAPAVLALICGALDGCGGTRADRAVIRVTPATGLYDHSRSIVVSHLEPREWVTVTATTHRPDGVWSARATFKANAAGVVDLASLAPTSGSYRGIAAMGLFSFQHRAGAGSGPADATETTLVVSAGTRRIASARVAQLLLGPDVIARAESLATVGFVARYFTPPGHGRGPAVVIWGGSDGAFGDGAAEAALLASHGIPALALAYFDAPRLPCSLSNIPLEYFVRAIRWLRSQPQVDHHRVWILAYSRGTEAELLIAAHWPTLVHGLVAGSPSSLVYGSSAGACPAPAMTAWTFRGRPLAPAVVTRPPTYNADGSISQVSALKGSLTGPAAKAATIPVAAFKGPVLLVTGAEDQVWPSDVFAGRIMTALRGSRAPHVHLNYPDAGHRALAIPYEPALTETGQRGILIDLGGTPAGDAAAHISDWPAAVRFISSR